MTGLLDSFAGWVRELALMLLLVGLAELLLPDSGLQRYARFVFGLVLLLVLLGPILPLANLGERIQEMQSEAVWSPWGWDDASPSDDALSPTALAQTGRQMSLELQRSTVVTWLVEHLEAMPGVERADVEIDLEEDVTANDFGTVRAVRAKLYVLPDDVDAADGRVDESAVGETTSVDSSAAESASAEASIERVKPVQRVRATSEEAEVLRHFDTAAWERKVRQRIREALGLPDGLLYVEVSRN